MTRIFFFLIGFSILSSCKVYKYAFIPDRGNNLDLYISTSGDQPIDVTNDKYVD